MGPSSCLQLGEGVWAEEVVTVGVTWEAVPPFPAPPSSLLPGCGKSSSSSSALLLCQAALSWSRLIVGPNEEPE